jgi:predicted MPP superfamily phosphohydrolase
MLFFLTAFFLLYALLHLYVFLKARLALRFGLLPGLTLALFMAVMITAPVVVRLLETGRLDPIARLLAPVGYTWMGVLFLMVCIFLVTDFYRFLLWAIQAVLQVDLSSFTFPARACFWMTLIVTAGIAVYGYFEALTIRTNRVVIRTSKVLGEKNPLRIAQISDVHLGPLVGTDRLTRIVSKVREAEPDIVISSGDLVDGQMDRFAELWPLLADVRPTYGKFAVTGNHEFYAGLRQSLAFTEKAGFRVLRGEAVTAAGIVIAGVDDPAGPGYGASAGFRETEMLTHLPGDKFILLLKHRPVFSPDQPGLFDLQLSGHLHGGQIFPFRIFTRLFFSYYKGLYHLPKGSELFVSMGSGTWGPPIRFLSPPEVTIIEIVHSNPR